MHTAEQAIQTTAAAPVALVLVGRETGNHEFTIMSADFAEMALADAERALRDVRRRLQGAPAPLRARLDGLIDALEGALSPGGTIQQIRWACGDGGSL